MRDMAGAGEPGHMDGGRQAFGMAGWNDAVLVADNDGDRRLGVGEWKYGPKRFCKLPAIS
jgi:hypothetical protein